MIALALDASGQTAGAALVSDGRVIAEFNMNIGLTHSAALMPLVDNIVKSTGFDLREADVVACTCGPGSFTGLRIGAACAMGLAAGLSKKMVKVPTLDALAYNVFKAEGVTASIMDARRREVYAAFYRYDGARLARVTGYMAEGIDVVLDMARDFGEPVVFLGDGADVNRDEILKEKNFFIAPRSIVLQRAASVGSLALEMAERGETVSPGEFSLMYVRKPQAEREYERKFNSTPLC